MDAGGKVVMMMSVADAAAASDSKHNIATRLCKLIGAKRRTQT